MQLRIRSITYLAEDVLGFEFTDPVRGQDTSLHDPSLRAAAE